MSKKQWLGLPIKDIYNIATSPTPAQQKYQVEFAFVYDALTKPKAEYPREEGKLSKVGKDMLSIRKQYLRNAQTGKGNKPRPPEFIRQGADIHGRNMAIANSRPRKNVEIDWDFWMDPEFMKE